MAKEQKIKTFGLLVLQDLNRSKRLNISRLAKLAGVSRPWVYKYFGSTPGEIAVNVVDSIAPLLTESDTERPQPKNADEWQKELVNSFAKTLEEADSYREAMEFYIRSFLTTSAYTVQIRNHEKRFQEDRVIPSLARLFDFNRKQAATVAEVLHSIRLGMVLNWMRETDKSAKNRSAVSGAAARCAQAYIATLQSS